MAKPMKAVRAKARTGARYKVTARSYIDGVIVGPGEANGDIVDYDGLPGSTLQPLNAEALKRKQEWAAKEAEQRTAANQRAAAASLGVPILQVVAGKHYEEAKPEEVHLWTDDARNAAAVKAAEEREAQERSVADENAKRDAAARKAGEIARKAEAAADKGK